MARFPYLPMAAIMATLVTDNVAQMNVTAYSGFMVENLGVVDDKDKAGYYAGVIFAAFMIGRLLSSHCWGLVSDRYGCRVVMVFGLCSTAVLSVCFGLSPTFAWAVCLRFLLGLLTGSMVACKTIVSDVCGKEHDTVGMGVTTAAYSLGQVLGPGVGGMLSEPATYHPGTFSEDGIFGRFPYLLPNLIVAGMAFLSLPLVLFFLEAPQLAESKNLTNNANSCAWICSWFYPGFGGDKDNEDGLDNAKNTLPTKLASGPLTEVDEVRVPSWMQTETAPAAATRNKSGYCPESLERDPRGTHHKSLLWQPHIGILLAIDAMFALTYSGLEAVFTLWALSTADKGGLDWSAVQIGQVFFACGLMLLVFELVAVPILTPRFGIRFCQRLGSVIEVPIHISIPLVSHMSIAGLPPTITAAILLFVFLACLNPFYIGLSLAINNAAGPERRGELNGISLTTSSISRSISPVFFSALFAASIEGNHPFPFDYHLAFYCIALVRLLVAFMGWNRVCDNGGVGKDSLTFEE